MQHRRSSYHRNCILTWEIIRPIQLLKTKFHVAFLRIYDVIRLHQVSGSSDYDDVMTEQVPGVSGANLVGRHLPSVPKSVGWQKAAGPCHTGHPIPSLFIHMTYQPFLLKFCITFSTSQFLNLPILKVKFFCCTSKDPKLR